MAWGTPRRPAKKGDKKTTTTEDEIGAPPPKKSVKGTPIGVEEDYYVPGGEVSGRGGQVGLMTSLAGAMPRRPIYFAADLDRPITDKWDGGKVADLQSRLVAVGLLAKKGWNIGIYDAKTRAAYKNLLAFANQQGMDAANAFATLSTSAVAGGRGGGGRTRAPLTIQLSNPDTLRSIINKTAPDVIGRSLSDAEASQLVSAFQTLEADAQRKAYSTAESGGTVVEPPNVQDFAERKARELHPGEAELFQKFSLAGDAMRILGLGGQVQER